MTNYSYIFGSLDETDQFLGKHKLPQMTKCEIDNYEENWAHNFKTHKGEIPMPKSLHWGIPLNFIKELIQITYSFFQKREDMEYMLLYLIKLVLH